MLRTKSNTALFRWKNISSTSSSQFVRLNSRRSSFKMSEEIPQKMAGVVVDAQMDNSRVITREEAYRKYREPDWAKDIVTERGSKFDPRTLAGKMSLSGTIKMNPVVADAINDHILKPHVPNHLRQSAANYYLELQQNKIHRPCKTPMEVDSHIASIFLQNYGSLYQSLYELRKRCIDAGKEFNPQRVLDVGYGPATGIVALNDLMGPEYRPALKDSVVVGSLEMQKRAKIILSRQYNEVVEFETQEDATAAAATAASAEERGTDDIEQADRLYGNIDTKKIRINTNLKKRVPGKPKQYDLIILQHQLLKDEHEFPLQVETNLQHYLQILAPGGHVVFVERGNPMGFEIIARARELVLRPEKHEDEPLVGKPPRLWSATSTESTPGSNDVYLKVVAPCAHHRTCPLQVGKPLYYEFKKFGNLNFCNNQKKIQRPKFSIELKRGKILGSTWSESPNEPGVATNPEAQGISGRRGATDYEILNYSYLILQRVKNSEDVEQSKHAAKGSTDESTDESLNVAESISKDIDTGARVVDVPLKKKGHVVLTLCGSSGDIEKVTIPKSFNKEIYYDARKSKKNDIWVHGGKTTVKSQNLLKTKRFEKFLKLEKSLYRQSLDQVKKNEFKLHEQLDDLRSGAGEAGVGENNRGAQTQLDQQIEILAKLHGNNFNLSEKGKKILKHKTKNKVDLRKIYEQTDNLD
ncbi:hypothetical protein ACO0QE_000424 [Hanseniaspora vineae]